jgi:hypothetical protein
MIEILSDKQEEIETTTDKTTKFEDVKESDYGRIFQWKSVFD